MDHWDLVNDILGKAWAPFIVSLDLSLNVVFQKVAVALLEGGGQSSQLVVHVLLVEDLANSDTGTSGLGLVTRADTLLGGAHGILTELNLLETIDKRVQFEQGVSAVADEDAVLVVEVVLLELLKLVEELRHADDSSGTNKVDGLGVDQTGRENVEVVSDTIDDDGVTSIVATSRASGDLELLRQEVDELALAYAEVRRALC